MTSRAISILRTSTQLLHPHSASSTCSSSSLITVAAAVTPTFSKRYHRSFATRKSSSQTHKHGLKAPTPSSDPSKVIGKVDAADPGTWILGHPEKPERVEAVNTAATESSKSTTATNTTTVPTDNSSATTAVPATLTPSPADQPPLPTYNPAVLDSTIGWGVDKDGKRIPVLLPEPSRPPLRKRIRDRWTNNREMLKNGGILSSVLGVGSYYTMASAGHVVDFLRAFDTGLFPNEISYLVGLGSSGVIFALYRLCHRLLRMNPSELYRHALRTALQHDVIRMRLGDGLTEGSVRQHPEFGHWHTAAVQPGGPRVWNTEGTNVNYLGWERFWRPSQLLTSFELKGTSEAGIVTALVTHKLNGVTDVRRMSLYLPNTAETLELIELPIERDLVVATAGTPMVAPVDAAAAKPVSEAAQVVQPIVQHPLAGAPTTATNAANNTTSAVRP